MSEAIRPYHAPQLPVTVKDTDLPPEGLVIYEAGEPQAIFARNMDLETATASFRARFGSTHHFVPKAWDNRFGTYSWHSAGDRTVAPIMAAQIGRGPLPTHEAWQAVNAHQMTVFQYDDEAA